MWLPKPKPNERREKIQRTCDVDMYGSFRSTKLVNTGTGVGLFICLHQVLDFQHSPIAFDAVASFNIGDRVTIAVLPCDGGHFVRLLSTVYAEIITSSFVILLILSLFTLSLSLSLLSLIHI